jgi:hypothetical protein
METKFKDVAHLYLGCKVQYVGIINGKEIGKYKMDYGTTHSSDDFFQVKNFNPPAEITGMKIGYLKRINWNKHSSNVYEIGTFQNGLKKYFANSLRDVKPILYPLSAMTEDQKDYLQFEIYGSVGEYFSTAVKENKKYTIDWRCAADITAYLLSQHFDLFGLIESGQAIDATTI